MEIKILRPNEIGYGIMIESDAGYIMPTDSYNNDSLIREFKAIENKSFNKDYLTVIAILQKHSVKNKNGRWYSEQILKRTDEKYQELIRGRGAVGELNHPESTELNADRVSHNIVRTWWEGKTLMGEIEILITDGFINYGIVSTAGDRVAHLLKRKIRIGISSRGVGSLAKSSEGDLVVQDDYEIICWDIVITPSTPGSWLLSNRAEAAQFVESTQFKTPILYDFLDKFLIK